MDFAPSSGNSAIHVTDVSRARKFYRDTLGFTLVRDSDEKLVFEPGKFKLYVNKDDKDMPFIPFGQNIHAARL